MEPTGVSSSASIMVEWAERQNPEHKTLTTDLQNPTVLKTSVIWAMMFLMELLLVERDRIDSKKNGSCDLTGSGCVWRDGPQVGASVRQTGLVMLLWNSRCRWDWPELPASSERTIRMPWLQASLLKCWFRNPIPAVTSGSADTLRSVSIFMDGSLKCKLAKGHTE